MSQGLLPKLNISGGMLEGRSGSRAMPRGTSRDRGCHFIETVRLALAELDQLLDHWML